MLVTGNRPEDIAEAAAELARTKANYDLLLAGTRSEDIAAAVLYFASPASSWVTGAKLVVDGGLGNIRPFEMQERKS